MNAFQTIQQEQTEATEKKIKSSVISVFSC
jgi:hypothetical protein